MRYVWEKITLALSTNRTTLLVGVVGFRTDRTEHQLEHDEYDNIWVMKPCEAIKMGDLKELQRHIQPSQTESGDAISAIVVAIDMIEKATLLKTGKLGKSKRKIVLLTDGQGHMDSDGLDDIARRIKDVEIELAVM
jgi:ATP-dependent DNA helicase 2 subunit 2